MNLHEHLRELVTYQGPSVVDTAESFRAALDDFLTEDEATTGELNLLVDAVRLGAVVRLRSILDHGGTPQAALEEAGDAFARDRGTDDLPRCRWAVAVVGYALGLLEAADVPPTGPQSIPSVTQRPAPTPPPPYAPTAAPPRTFPETEAVESMAAPPASPPQTPPGQPGWTPAPRPRRRSRRALMVLLVAAVVAAAVFAGVWLGNRDEEPEQSGDDPGGSAASEGEPTGGEDTGGTEGSSGAPAIPENSIVLPLIDGNGDSAIYAVDADSGDSEQLTDGPDDRNPAISPDRSTMIYLDGAAGGSTKPMVMDVETGKVRPLFRDDGVCDYAARPAFNPDGKRLAVLCLDEFGGYAGTAIVNLRGVYEAGLPVSGEPLGSPTWTSGSTLVYVRAGYPEDQPTTLWETEVNGLSAPVQLTDGSEGWDTHPDWSEDAGEAGLLVFSRHQDAKPFGDLMTGDAEAQPGPATSGELWGHPAWSPDGTRVVFTVRDDLGIEQLAVASLEDDGFSEPEFVPNLPGEPGVPAWGTR